MAGARGIEPRSKVLETFILTVVLCPYEAQNYPTVTDVIATGQANPSQLFFGFDFVAAEILFGLNVPNVFASNRVIFAQAQFIRRIHRIFHSVIMPVSAFFADQTDNLTLITFFRHNPEESNR